VLSDDKIGRRRGDLNLGLLIGFVWVIIRVLRSRDCAPYQCNKCRTALQVVTKVVNLKPVKECVCIGQIQENYAV
jgi:hypothetical protein